MVKPKKISIFNLKNSNITDHINRVFDLNTYYYHENENEVKENLNQHKNHSASHDEVVTVIRTTGDTQTEHHLSAVIRSLRESGDISVAELIEMHPLYIKGDIKKHGDLIKILVDKKEIIKKYKIEAVIHFAGLKFYLRCHDL